MISDEMTKFFYKFDYKIQVLHRISQLSALHVFPRDVKTPISKHLFKFIRIHPHPLNIKKPHKKQTTKQIKSREHQGGLCQTLLFVDVDRDFCHLNEQVCILEFTQPADVHSLDTVVCVSSDAPCRLTIR